MASMKLLVIVAFVASVFCGVQCQEETPSGPNAIDMVTQPQGVRVVFPFFSPKLKTIDEKLKQYFNEDTEETVNYLRDSLIKLVRNGEPLDPDSYAILKKTLYKTARNQRSRREPLQKSIKIRGEFNDANKGMFIKLMTLNDAKFLSIVDEPKNYEKLAEDLDNYFDTLKQALATSPVGIYIDYEHGMIGDSSFMDVSSSIMVRLEQHGYSLLFWLIKRLLKEYFSPLMVIRDD